MSKARAASGRGHCTKARSLTLFMMFPVAVRTFLFAAVNADVNKSGSAASLGNPRSD
jgi:hypothetical protein